MGNHDSSPTGEFTLNVEPSRKVAYLYLPTHPAGNPFGCVKKVIELRDYIQNYKGPDINFDFDENGEMIGVEILY